MDRQIRGAGVAWLCQEPGPDCGPDGYDHPGGHYHGAGRGKQKSGNGQEEHCTLCLYRAEGYVSANLARKTTGFSEEDLELL